MPPVVEFHGYGLHPVIGPKDDHVLSAIIDLWRRNRAFSGPVDMAKRAREAVILVRDAAGDGVGVSTAYLGRYPGDGQTYFFYRMFVRPADRVPGLMRVVTEETWRVLRDSPARTLARGVIIVTDNRKLMRPGMQRMFARYGWENLGRSRDGKDVWRKGFDFRPGAATPHRRSR